MVETQRRNMLAPLFLLCERQVTGLWLTLAELINIKLPVFILSEFFNSVAGLKKKSFFLLLSFVVLTECQRHPGKVSELCFIQK